jgi:CRISPR-associated endonuclease/helicase Cas3
MTFLGHSENDSGRGVVETLKDHLEMVASKSATFANEFNAKSQAYETGILHDLGKYSEQFLKRLSDPAVKGRDHWSIGAVCAAKISEVFGIIPALAIEGHHVGLGNLGSAVNFLTRVGTQFKEHPAKFTTTDVGAVLKELKADGFALPKFETGFAISHDWVGDMFDTRMLFSTLVDADFLETESHFEGDKQCPRRPRANGQSLNIERAIQAFERYLETIASASETNAFVKLRTTLGNQCRTAGAEVGQGVFTLTAPTGTGKTLAMLGFALEHARKHGLRRIVLVMPFLNIIDQTARIYRKMFSAREFGDDFILECHSLADEAIDRIERPKTNDEIEDDVSSLKCRRRMLSENWDAPIVLTTHIQLLESMFAHRPSRCRKLHRLAGAVILFDEIQTLPPKLVVPTLSALNKLAGSGSRYHATVVFSTATQPAFEVLSNRVGSLVDVNLFKQTRPTWKPKEIVVNSAEMFQTAAGRVQIIWRHGAAIEFETLAAELKKHRQVLCVVNLKRHATKLASQLENISSHVYHLSTNMCTAHRLAVLDEVRERLDKDKSVRLIATQCVEAGVDIDFPNVYRALAPLEAIAQAAGRCNRSALFPSGKVVVFKPYDIGDDGREKKLYPPGYNAAVDATESFLNGIQSALSENTPWPEIINSPERLSEYYRLFYAVNGRDKTEHQDEQEVLAAIKCGSFPEVSKAYRLIEQNVINVLVPYDQATFDKLVAESEHADMKPWQVRAWVRKARFHSVSVFRPSSPQADLWNQLVALPLGLDDDEIQTDTHEWWRTSIEQSYDGSTGLVLGESQWVV